MKEGQEFIIRFEEGENGPYELRGRAFAIYRAAILIGYDRKHIRYVILDENRNEIPLGEFMHACLKDTGSIK